MKNPYYPIDTVVEDVITETPTIKTYVLKPARPIQFKAGQFMQLTVPGVGEAPFTPSSDPNHMSQEQNSHPVVMARPTPASAQPASRGNNSTQQAVARAPKKMSQVSTATS